jgi:hypothetical protein
MIPAVVLGWIAPLLKLPTWVWLLLALLVGGLLVYHWGDVHGASREHARWVAAEKATLKLGKDARDQAEKEFPLSTVGGLASVPDSPLGGKPCRVFDDLDRECQGIGVRAR